MSQAAGNSSRNEDSDLSALDSSIKECVRYLLCCEGGKVPIKHSDVTKHLHTVCGTASNRVPAVLNEANKALKRIYGYELIKVDAKPSKYIVVLNKPCESVLPEVVDETPRRLLIAALMHIFMTGAPVPEDDMWQFLASAGLMEEYDNASRKLLTHTFVRQMYLEYVKATDEPGNVKYEFKWGQRADAEVPKRFMLNKMAEAFEKTPEYWGEQYKAATEEENQSTT